MRARDVLGPQRRWQQ